MCDIKIVYIDSSHVKVIAKLGIIKELREHFSFFVEGFQFSPKYLYSNWDGRICLLTPDGLFPYGLVETLVKYAKSNMLSVEIDPNVIDKYDLSRQDFDDWINSKTYYSGQDEIYPYWYQLDSVYQALVEKRQILNLPTSAGKSLIQALLSRYTIEHSDQNVLIIVPTIDLVSQMKNDFVDYRLFTRDEIGEIRSGIKDSGQRVIISTWQSACKKPQAWFNQFGMTLCDEVHLAVGKTISDIIKKLNQCDYKIGLSGSLKDGKANLYQYIGLFGSIYKPVSTLDLMREGQVSQLEIYSLFLKYPEKISKAISGVDFTTEMNFLMKSKRRNDWICNLGIKLASNNENVFIMFNNIQHGKLLVETLKSKGHDKVFYVAGEISGEERTRLKQYTEENTGVIIVASYGTFSTGVSVKNLHHVIFSIGFKSKIRILQTIGRVLRKHSSKSVAKIWDIVDDMSITVTNSENIKRRINVNHSLKQGIERIERYTQEGYTYVLKEINFLNKNGT